MRASRLSSSCGRPAPFLIPAAIRKHYWDSRDTFLPGSSTSPTRDKPRDRPRKRPLKKPEPTAAIPFSSIQSCSLSFSLSLSLLSAVCYYVRLAHRWRTFPCHGTPYSVKFQYNDTLHHVPRANFARKVLLWARQFASRINNCTSVSRSRISGRVKISDKKMYYDRWSQKSD